MRKAEVKVKWTSGERGSRWDEPLLVSSVNLKAGRNNGGWVSRKFTLPMSVEVDRCSPGTLSHSFCGPPLSQCPFSCQSHILWLSLLDWQLRIYSPSRLFILNLFLAQWLASASNPASLKQYSVGTKDGLVICASTFTQRCLKGTQRLICGCLLWIPHLVS